MNRRTLAILYLTIFIDLLCVGMVIPVLPGLVIDELGAGERNYGLIASLVPLSQLLFASFWGNLSDRFGRKKILQAGVLFNFLGSILLSFTNSIELLIISRLIAGIGSANYAVAQAYVSDVSQPEIRTKNIGIIGSAIGLAFITGPALGTFLKSLSGIQGLGLFCASLSIVNLIFIRLEMPESNYRSDLVDHRNFGKRLSKALTNQNTRILFLIYSLFIGSFSMMQIASPLLWKSIYGMNDTSIGWMFTLIGVCSVLVQTLLTGKIRNHITEKAMLIIGLLVIIPTLLVFPNIDKAQLPFLIAPLLFLFALSNGLVVPSLNTMVSLNSEKHEQGVALGALQSAGALSRIFGPALSGMLFIIDFKYPFYVGSIIALLCLIAGLTIKNKTI